MKKIDKVVMIIPITIAILLLIYNIRDTYCVSDLISEVNSEMVKITSDDKYMIIPSSCSVNLLKTYISTNEKWYIKNQNGKVIDENQVIGTNYSIVFEKNGDTKSLTIVVIGDYTYDGETKLDDLNESLVYFSKILSTKENKITKDLMFYVSDYNKDNKLSLVDVSGIVKQCYETIEQNNVNVTGVSLNKTSLSLYPNETDTLVATVLPGNATNKAITWNSSDTSVATVDSKGKVKGISVGKAIVTARANNGITATVTVTVNELPKKTETIVANINANVRDPFVLVDNGTYYMYSTGYHCYKNGSGSLNGAWSSVNDFVSMPSDAETDYWAPEVHKYNNAYYMFSTYRSKTTGHRGVAIFKSNSAAGPFTMISDGHVTPKELDNIDGTLYVDENNNPWIIFVGEWTTAVGNKGTINVARLSKDLTKIEGEIKEVFKVTSADWIYDSNVTDGPFVYKNSKSQLLMLWSSFASDGSYSVGIASSPKIDGIWTQKGLFYTKSTTSRNLDGGHGMIFKDTDGTMYMALHSPNSSSKSQLTQAIFIPISEDANGNLVINK